ncbi:MAG: hypothetical protein ACTSV7_09225 [Candidatus Baldrarchaeia archaeon]
MKIEKIDSEETSKTLFKLFKEDWEDEWKNFFGAGFKFDWEGGLEELKDKFSSVELQHKINEVRVKKYLKKK